MPDVPRPRTARPGRSTDPIDGTINERLDQRIAKARDFDELDGSHGDGRCVLWARIPDVLEASTPPRSPSSATSCRWASARRSGSSAAATASTTPCGSCTLVPTEWVLLDIRVHAVERGFGHGLVHMFAEDGTLLATASQSCIVRSWDQRRRRRHLPIQEVATP